jgi:hypothetical protein
MEFADLPDLCDDSDSDDSDADSESSYEESDQDDFDASSFLGTLACNALALAWNVLCI